MREIKRTKEKAQEVADKITPIFGVIELLSEEDIEYLKDTAKQIREENSKREAVAGILIDLDKADTQNALGQQATERITGLILIWSAIHSKKDIMKEYHRKAMQTREIEQMFGL